MKHLPYILKHLRRNWLRTMSTVLAMALCIFLFCTLQSVLAEINAILDAQSANRLVTRHAVSLVFPIPFPYKGRIEGVEGVKRVSTVHWFGGLLPVEKEELDKQDESSTADFSKLFPNFAVEPETYLAMYPEYELPEDQYRAFVSDMRGCVIGRKLADRYGWSVGDTFFLESFIPTYRKPDGPFEFVVRGIFDVDEARYPAVDSAVMLFDERYLYEATGRQLEGAGIYYVEIEDVDQAAEVGRRIDALFENSEAQTLTETEKAFQAGFIAMAGNLALLLNGIGLAVTFTILLVTANTMSMAVRERRTEIAVLKTLGFKSGQVMGLIVAEALVIGVLGGLIGIGGAYTILTQVPGLRDALATLGLAELDLRPLVAAMGLSMALFLAFVAGLVPALGAYRARITDMLRTV